MVFVSKGVEDSPGSAPATICIHVRLTDAPLVGTSNQEAVGASYVPRREPHDCKLEEKTANTSRFVKEDGIHLQIESHSLKKELIIAVWRFVWYFSYAEVSCKPLQSIAINASAMHSQASRSEPAVVH